MYEGEWKEDNRDGKYEIFYKNYINNINLILKKLTFLINKILTFYYN